MIHIPLHTSGVYRVKFGCRDCYIGESGRLITARNEEYILYRCTKSLNIEHSAVTEHLYLAKYSLDCDKVEMMGNSSQYYERYMIETIEIRKHKNNFNKYDAF